MKKILLFMLMTTLFQISYSKTEEKIRLIPEPAEMVIEKGTIRLSTNWQIWLNTDTLDDLYAAELLQKEMKDCFGWDIEIHQEKPKRNYIVIQISKEELNSPKFYNEQGYRLNIESGKITIEAPSPNGRFYGVQTLRQLLRGSKSGQLKKLVIRDYPALQWRGISDDISRGQVSNLEDFKNIIRQLAYYKKNIYQPYIEDMFEFEIDPDIGSQRGHITKIEMARMVEEARKNHIILCPVFESLGHQDRLLSLPENRKYAEIQDTSENPWSFSPALPEAKEFVKKLIDEMAVATPSPFFHIGGDESWDVGRGLSKEMVENSSIGKVHAEYYSDLVDYLEKKHNRQVMLYGDMILKHKDAMEYMRKDCIIVDWHYSPEDYYPSVTTLKSAGFNNILVSPGIWGWANFYPNYSHAFKNIRVLTDIAKKENCMGTICSSWGDDGAENLRENNWAGFAFSAACAWSPNSPESDEFLETFVVTQYGTESPELAKIEKLLGFLELPEIPYPARTFHLTPKIRTSNPSWLEQMKTMGKNMEEAQILFAKSKDKVRFHRDHMKIIDHVIKRFQYMSRSYLILEDVARKLDIHQIDELPLSEQLYIQYQLEHLRDSLLEISSEYPGLWLQKNKYPMLEYNIDRLYRQVSELQNFITLANRGELKSAPKPVGEWFWYPEGEPTVKSEIGNSYFLRPFNLDKKPKSVVLRCWADDAATVYINGRRSISVDYYKQPATRNITRFVTDGLNHLAIEAKNDYGAAGIILELQIEFDDESVLLITGDNQWKTAKEINEGWLTGQGTNIEWTEVKLLGKGAIEPWTFINW